MLLSKTKLGLSDIEGIGLFADENIPEGTVFAMDTDFGIARYSQQQWEQLEKELSPESFKQIKRYVFKNKEDGLYWLFLDDTRFVNHSDNPNIGSVKNNGADNDVALRDIKKGEEILIDYTSFYDPAYFEEIMKL